MLSSISFIERPLRTTVLWPRYTNLSPPCASPPLRKNRTPPNCSSTNQPTACARVDPLLNTSSTYPVHPVFQSGGMRTHLAPRQQGLHALLPCPRFGALPSLASPPFFAACASPCVLFAADVQQHRRLHVPNGLLKVRLP